MKKKALGLAIAAAGILTQGGSAFADSSSDKLDLVLKRLDTIEQSNSKLAKENAALRDRLNKVEKGKHSVVVQAAPEGKGPAPGTGTSVKAPSGESYEKFPFFTELDSNGHAFLEKKHGNKATFYTPGGEITAYGNIDVSVDGAAKTVSGYPRPAGTPSVNAPAVGNMGWMPDISTNSSYLGVRGFQYVPNLSAAFVYQLEVGFELSATPGTKETDNSESNTVNGAMFNRNTYIGFSSPEWGAIKIGKTMAPYDTSTAAFNPFAGEIGDYHVIMGNTGGDNRVEFGTRLDHSIWYESPSISGFQLNALFSPGQNRSTDSADIAAGESDCTGGNNPQSTGNNPVACIDGSYSDAASANLSYTHGPFYATVAAEWHHNVNRQNDISGLYGLSPSPTALVPQSGLGPPAGITPYGAMLYNADVADEEAYKFGALYHFATKTTVGGIFEMMRRNVPAFLQFQNERSRNGTWLFVSQEITPVDSISIGWAHAFAANGDPGQHNSASIAFDGTGAYAPNDNQADMVTANYKRKVDANLTWYTAVAATFNGPSAHYDLGAGGHGITTDCHDASGADGGYLSNPICFTGTTIVGVSTGIQWRF